MKKLFALLLLIAGPALADPVEFTVIHPTQFDDNTPITVPVGTAIDCGPTPVAGDFAGGWGYIASVTSPATTVTSDLAPGTYYCAAHSAIGRDAQMSAYSNVVTFTVSPPVVVPPVAQPPVSTTPKPPVLKVLLK